MSQGLSQYSEQKVCDWANGKASMPATTTRYLALFTTDPTAAGSGTEVSGGSYAREAITTLMGSSSGSVPATATNSGGAIIFPTATASWGTVGYFGVFDAPTAGNLIYYGPLSSAVAVASGQTVLFNTSTFTLNVT